MFDILPTLKKIFIASDHGGFSLKQPIVDLLQTRVSIEDLGPASADSVDYPHFAQSLCLKIPSDSVDTFGILICGSGQGMAMTANKFPHIRAAVVWSEESAMLSRAHNNANVLCLGARLISQDLALKIVQAFFSTSFEGGRHQRRVDQIKQSNAQQSFERG